MTLKLIRDKIPELALTSNDTLHTRRLTDDEFKQSLKQKLIEEATEVSKADEDLLVEELADCEEVIRSIAELHHITLDQIESKRQQKFQTNGGFTKRLLLIGKNGKTYE